MSVMILAILLAGQPNIAKSGSHLAIARTIAGTARDVQQIAIDTIIARSPVIRATPVAMAERAGPNDPQAEIVERITGKNNEHSGTNDIGASGADIQSAIVRAIAGRE